MRAASTLAAAAALVALAGTLAAESATARGARAPAAAAVRRDWPCPGCLTLLPHGYRAGKPAPLLVVLHGDEGTPAEIASAWASAADRANVILFAPECPTDEGCRFANGAGATNSWWGWLQFSGRYDDAWIGRQVDRVAAAYSVDRAREYIAGWSGGADFLGWYALRHADRFAAAAFVAGGVPYARSCPAKPLAGYFLLGAADPRAQTGQPGQVKAVLDTCRDPTTAVVLPAADHVATMTAVASGYASTILAWLQRHSRR